MSVYGDVNPVPTSPLADDLVTALSGLVFGNTEGDRHYVRTAKLNPELTSCVNVTSPNSSAKFTGGSRKPIGGGGA